MEHVRIKAVGQKREKINKLVQAVISAAQLEDKDIYLWDNEQLSQEKHIAA